MKAAKLMGSVGLVAMFLGLGVGSAIFASAVTPPSPQEIEQLQVYVQQNPDAVKETYKLGALFFLSKRFQTHQIIMRQSASAIQDRSIYEDAHIFARALHESGKMEDRDYQNYLELYKTMLTFLPPPDLVVYVRRSVDCLKSRIAERGREYEKDIPDEYLHQLNRCYDDWIEGYKIGKVLTVQADSLDMKWNRADFDYVCRSIENSLEQPELNFTC